MLVAVLKLCKKYRELRNESMQDKVFLATLSEFVIHTKIHSDKEIVANDMINAVKLCINKGLYDVAPVDNDYTQDEAYRSFAEQMFNFIEEMDKE